MLLEKEVHMSTGLTWRSFALLCLSFLIVMAPIFGFSMFVTDGNLLVACIATAMWLFIPSSGLAILAATATIYWLVFAKGWQRLKRA